MQLDNSTFPLKRKLRQSLLARIKNPIVMETHGGFGKLFASCYSTLTRGIAFELEEDKADFLAQQRPTWSVYRGDVVTCLRGGAGSHLEINFLDLDPWGDPWPAVDAFFGSTRKFPDTMVIVANDGLRQKLHIRDGWRSKSMQDAVGKYGNQRIFKIYKELCRELLTAKILPLGYRIDLWNSYYCGDRENNTHWAGVLKRT